MPLPKAARVVEELPRPLRPVLAPLVKHAMGLAVGVVCGALLMLLAKPFYRLRGFRPPLSPAQLASLKRHWRFDDAKARRELGWTPRGIDDGLPPTVEFLGAT